MQQQNTEKQVKIDEMSEYYKKVLIFSEEINRLNGVLVNKEKEIQEYLETLFEYKERIKKFEEELNRIGHDQSKYKH